MYKALLLCNSVFPDDPAALPRLHGPVRDGLLLWTALVDPLTGCFRQENVEVLFEGSRNDMAAAAERFFSEAAADDVLIFYYSGHGRRASSELMLCCRDTVATRPIATGLMSDSLNKMIERSSARAVIVILDCCFSGAFKGVAPIEDDLAGEGRFVIAATSAYEEVKDADEAGSASPFTAALVAGLAGGARRGSDRVTLDDVYAYVENAISAPHPKPRKNFDGTGSVVMAYHPAAPPVRIANSGVENSGSARPVDAEIRDGQEIDICFTQGESAEALPTPLLVSEKIVCVDAQDIPDFPTDEKSHRDYYKRVVRYYQDKTLLQSFRLGVTAGDQHMLNLYMRIESKIPSNDFGLRFVRDRDIPFPPQAPPKPGDPSSRVTAEGGIYAVGHDVSVGPWELELRRKLLPELWSKVKIFEDGSYLEMELEAPRLLPRQVVFFNQELHVVTSRASMIAFEARVYPGNARPYQRRLELELKVIKKELTYREILQAANVELI